MLKNNKIRLITMKNILLFISLLILSSCAPTNTKPMNVFPSEGDFKVEPPPNNGNARLYIYYPQSQAIKAHSTISIGIDNEILAIIRNRTFTKLELPAGEKLILNRPGYRGGSFV